MHHILHWIIVDWCGAGWSTVGFNYCIQVRKRQWHRINCMCIVKCCVDHIVLNYEQCTVQSRFIIHIDTDTCDFKSSQSLKRSELCRI
jgi:hypothetical protein